MAEKCMIPEVSPERLAELAKRIRPVVRFPFLGKCYIRSVGDLCHEVYLNNPMPARPAWNIKPLADITTYHTPDRGYGPWDDFFGPTVAEVLAQIPAELLNRVVAFEILDDDEEPHPPNGNGLQVATTRLYARKW